MAKIGGVYSYTPKRTARLGVHPASTWRVRGRPAADWGFATPFCIHWVAVAGDDTQHPKTGVLIPRGALVLYREWYGASSPNVGLRMTAEEVAEGIVRREITEKVSAAVLDPSAFAEGGGPSYAERMNKILLASSRQAFCRADNARVASIGKLGGWDQVRARLKANSLFIFDTATELIRTLPSLLHDPDKAEDLDTEQEDHAADALRYACMSRPFITKIIDRSPPPEDWRHSPPLIAKNDGAGGVYMTGGETPMQFAMRRMRMKKAARG